MENSLIPDAVCAQTVLLFRVSDGHLCAISSQSMRHFSSLAFLTFSLISFSELFLWDYKFMIDSSTFSKPCNCLFLVYLRFRSLFLGNVLTNHSSILSTSNDNGAPSWHSNKPCVLEFTTDTSPRNVLATANSWQRT